MRRGVVPGRAFAALVCALALGACVSPVAVVPDGPAPSTASDPACRVTYVVDGDTVHMSCAGRGEVKARLLGFDTPEVVSPGCNKERAAGQEATRLLRALLGTGPITGADFQGHDRYGRDLVRLQVAGQDVARAMISTGYAVPYAGGRRIEWCDRL